MYIFKSLFAWMQLQILSDVFIKHICVKVGIEFNKL